MNEWMFFNGIHEIASLVQGKPDRSAHLSRYCLFFNELDETSCLPGQRRPIA